MNTQATSNPKCRILWFQFLKFRMLSIPYFSKAISQFLSWISIMIVRGMGFIQDHSPLTSMTSPPRLAQNLSTIHLPIAVPWSKFLTHCQPSTPPKGHGENQVKIRVDKSRSSRFLPPRTLFSVCQLVANPKTVIMWLFLRSEVYQECSPWVRYPHRPITVLTNDHVNMHAFRGVGIGGIHCTLATSNDDHVFGRLDSVTIFAEVFSMKI